jgi:hypothetical protein
MPVRAVLAECFATFAPGNVTAHVRFVGQAGALTGLEITVPIEVNDLAELKSALRKLRIRARLVRRTAAAGRVHHLLDLAELDGSDVSRERWAVLQGTVLNCIMRASMLALGERQPRGSWRVFRDMLQKAPSRSLSMPRRHA